MLPKLKRITTQDFKGKNARPVYRGALFDLSISPSDTSKFACIISKKRIKRSVDRNKVKRRVYSSLQDATPRTPSLVFVYPTKNALYAPQTAIKEEIMRAFATL